MKSLLKATLVLGLISFWLGTATSYAQNQDGTPESTPAVSEASEEISAADVFTNSIGMKLKLIKPGSFMMGANSDADNEGPIHKVTLTKSFYIGVYEVTQQQYEKVMGTTPSRVEKPRRPVDTVSWIDAHEFCQRLSRMENRPYRLPTEAEWEYACRAGTTTEYYWGDEPDDRYAWTGVSGPDDVGTRLPNAWGLYDMSGNVWEWCADRYGLYSPDGTARSDPKGPSRKQGRVLRGGSRRSVPWYCRSAYRKSASPISRNNYFGFRIVLDSKTTGAVRSQIDVIGERAKRLYNELDGRDVLTNSIGMKLKLIEPGSFVMGSFSANQVPTQKTQTKPFYIGVCEVTQQDYEKVMGVNPSRYKGPGRPVDSVSWNDANDFCQRLSEMENRPYRLPTEVEWEYACRSGTTTDYYWGNTPDGRYAWTEDNSSYIVHDVGTRLPNAWGLHDMSGSVWEWCADVYVVHYRRRATTPSNPYAPPQLPREPSRVLRGGSWYTFPWACLSSSRHGSSPSARGHDGGFRVVMDAK
ncbi:MAG: formylglycine-generating enzyme family protein [Planctomycetota bacterium]